MATGIFACKFTPMEFETTRSCFEWRCRFGVNLLRWSLKLCRILKFHGLRRACKFTPMEFETDKKSNEILGYYECKFTPMEFETS